MSLTDFNELDDAAARERLLVCLDVPRWADAVAGGRPYDDIGQVEAAMTAASATITDNELEQALARHPRIGERADAAKHDAAHSTREQSGVDQGDADLARRLEEGNRAYEERFGRVFIVRAAGRPVEVSRTWVLREAFEWAIRTAPPGSGAGRSASAGRSSQHARARRCCRGGAGGGRGCPARCDRPPAR